MNVSKVYLLWALGVAGGALVLGMCLTAGLVLALRGALRFPDWLSVLAGKSGSIGDGPQ